MRSIYDIQKDIARAKWVIDQLILEKKLTLQVMWDMEESSKEIAKKAIEKMMDGPSQSATRSRLQASSSGCCKEQWS